MELTMHPLGSSDPPLRDHLRLLVKKPLLQIRAPQRPLIRSVCCSCEWAHPPDSHSLTTHPLTFTDSLGCVFLMPSIPSLAVISKCDYDHVVEEHFQRSLGMDYQKARSQQLSISVSVDDHFAKALGDKWLQIKSKSSSCSSTPPSSPSVTHSPTYSHSPNQSLKEPTSSSSPTSSHWSIN